MGERNKFEIPVTEYLQVRISYSSYSNQAFDASPVGAHRLVTVGPVSGFQ